MTNETETVGSAPETEVSSDQADAQRDYVLQGPGEEDILAGNSDRVQRIRALLAQWMRMENLVVLMASGCSAGRHIGGLTLGPLEDNVLSVLRARYAAAGAENETLRQIVEARASARSSEGTQTFEQWLTYISNTQYLLEAPDSTIRSISWSDSAGNDLPVSGAILARVLSDLEHTIYGYCSLALPPLEVAPTGHHSFMAKLVARDPGLGRAHVFTLNYDTVIEQSLDHLGIQYFDGFAGRTQPKFDPSIYGLDVYYPGDVAAGRVRRYDKFLHLYKLHGSVHWTQTSDGTTVAVHKDLAPFQAWREETNAEVRARQLDSLWPDSHERIAILPTANKFVQTMELPYSHLFRSLHQRLHIPQTFFIVAGYGFGDEHVNQIIDSAMTNPSLVMLVVTPSATEPLLNRMGRYQNIGERVFLLTSDSGERARFDDFSFNLMPQVQWLDEFIQLRRYEKLVGDTAGGGGSSDLGQASAS